MFRKPKVRRKLLKPMHKGSPWPSVSGHYNIPSVRNENEMAGQQFCAGSRWVEMPAREGKRVTCNSYSLFGQIRIQNEKETLGQ